MADHTVHSKTHSLPYIVGYIPIFAGFSVDSKSTAFLFGKSNVIPFDIYFNIYNPKICAKIFLI